VNVAFYTLARQPKSIQFLTRDLGRFGFNTSKNTDQALIPTSRKDDQVLDRIHLHHHEAPRGPTRVDVHEHRAPTDQSVKLLREMEAKAESNILATIRLTDCPVDCVIHHMKSSLTQRIHFIVMYKISGKEYRLDYHSDPFVDRTPEQIVVGIKTALALDLSIHLLSPGFTKLLSDPTADFLQRPRIW
jgi:hypothetical protein